MSKESVKAVVDVNEPAKVFGEVAEHDEVEDTLIEPLAAADIVVGGIGFERKTWSDFVQSMKDGRLEEQDAKMEAYDVAYILIDEDEDAVKGNLDETENLPWTKMSPKSIRGRMWSLTAREQYHVRAVLPCSNTRLLADTAVTLARKHTEDPSSPYLPTGAVGVDEPVGKRMWGTIPDVGPELAGRLYERFGSPTMFVRDEDAIDAKLINVPGIAAKTAAKILQALEGEYDG